MNEKNVTTDLLLETAQIHWHELQRFFASGHAVAVDESLDLIYVATQITQDNATQVKLWMDAGLVDVVKDVQASIWHEKNSLVWAVVVKPWVLVQEKNHSQTSAVTE